MLIDLSSSNHPIKGNVGEYKTKQLSNSVRLSLEILRCYFSKLNTIRFKKQIFGIVDKAT